MNHAVVLQRLPRDSIATLRALRLLAGVGLREAKELQRYLAENLPCRLVDGIGAVRAAEIAECFNGAGGLAIVEPSELTHPLFLCPAVSVKRELSFLRGLREK